MRLKPGENALGALGVAFATIFLLSNTSGLGVGLLAADLLWLLTRLEIIESHETPGRYTTIRGRLGVTKLILLLAIYGATIYGIFVIQHDFGTKARATAIAEFGLAGLCFMLLGELQRSGQATLNWFVGARAEREVGSKLDMLKQQGWLVLHGFKTDRADIDHILCGPQGAFAIETKSYGYRAADLRQARRNAWQLRERLGVQCWVTGVLCVDEERRPEEKDRVWVVSHSDLVDWIRRQHNVPVDPEQARSRLLSLTGDGSDPTPVSV